MGQFQARALHGGERGWRIALVVLHRALVATLIITQAGCGTLKAWWNASFRKPGIAYVKWTLTHEYDIRRYRIYRAPKIDGPWRLIAIVPGKGQGYHGAQHYCYADRGVFVGDVVYYKIEHESINGKVLSTGPVRYVVQPVEAPDLPANSPAPTGTPPDNRKPK